MSVIKPFRALRPRAEFAKQVSSVPYDVLNTEEARALAAGNPDSFLHVSRSEIDLAPTVDPYADEVYRKAKENFERLERDGVLETETEAALYVYRLEMGEQVQTSVVACCSIDEYDTGLIKKHEKTRPDKENDRTRHMIELEAQTGLIFLCYRGRAEIDALVAETVETAPLYDFEAEDVNGNSIRHTVWKAGAPAALVEAFAKVPALYIADGHHRAASSSRARAFLRRETLENLDESAVCLAPEVEMAEAEYNYVIAALFPAEQLKILAYNRVVKDLNGLSVEEFFQKVAESGFNVLETADPTPENPGEICVYADGKWRKLRFNILYFADPGVIETLDVSRLENHILRPILGIEDVRTDKRIDFVGGIRGTSELEKLVDSGQWRIAFSMYPTTVEQLLRVSDEDRIMPPKSTWFEPKLRDGLLIHKF
ncbi:MAG: DUF1015 domain-containing protein [Acidobacteria bacterium]|nr:DUF1015 domain-containing protein [Acidobacteriota bacterium]